MRLLSAAQVQSKNVIDGGNPWTFLYELDIAGGPTPFRLANYDQDIVFHGNVFQRFPTDVDSLEDANSNSLVHIRVTAANVDQQIQSLLENYWAPVIDPQWTVTLWNIDVTMPDETAFAAGEVFTVASVTTDLVTAVFDLIAEGYSLTTSLPKRRFTSTNGFPLIPRRV